jgi:hypothetical protein
MLSSASMKNINDAKNAKNNNNDPYHALPESPAGPRSDADLLALINAGRARLWGIPEEQLPE